MAKGTGSTASTKRMQNMITQVNNNSNGNGDVLNPHIPPVQNLSEPGEHSTEEMKLMEGTTVLPTLTVESEKNASPKETRKAKHFKNRLSPVDLSSKITEFLQKHPKYLKPK